MNDVIKSINVDGVEYDIQAKELTKVTYAELKELRDNGGLAAGHLYRITDYEFTTKQVETKSAGHVFDIIVLAVAENELSHIARAIAHEGDTYFDGNDLGAWELWYELDNDAEKYAWADAENGKGIIYRMIDEKRNDCPYDFKNALFLNTYTSNTTDEYCYTFSYVVKSVLYDGTVEAQVKKCYGNSMGVTWTLLKKKEMNRNVFRNSLFEDPCYYNTFGRDCHSNTFGGSCHSNTFGGSCHSNTFGRNCYSNTFGDKCYSNTFGYNCYSNTFGHKCYSNTFGNSCYYNTFGLDCHSNTFGNSYINNTFGANVANREVNEEKTSITLNDEYFDDGSGQLVPIKHPDLSTQPSILPYKFMGQYVYEQLICLGSSTKGDHSYSLRKGFLTDIAHPLGVKNPIVIKVDGFAYGRGELWNPGYIYTPAPYIHGVPVNVSIGFSQSSDSEVADLRTLFKAERPSDINFGREEGIELTYYARVVFTSLPEDNGGYYYGGDELPTSGILVKFESTYNTIERVYVYNGDVYLEGIKQNDNYYVAVPSDYVLTSTTGLKVVYTGPQSMLTATYYIPNSGERGYCIVPSDSFVVDQDLFIKSKETLVEITFV